MNLGEPPRRSSLPRPGALLQPFATRDVCT